jgi:hypothetical protein
MSDSSPTDHPPETPPPLEPTPQETPPIKVKAPRTPKQLAAFERARATRMKNIEKAKQDKPRRKHRKIVELPQEEEQEQAQGVDMEISLDELADRLTERIVKRMPRPKTPEPPPVRAPLQRRPKGLLPNKIIADTH